MSTYHKMKTVVKGQSGDKNGNSPGDKTQHHCLVDRHYPLAAEYVVHPDEPELEIRVQLGSIFSLS